MTVDLKRLGDLKHLLREAQIKLKKDSDRLIYDANKMLADSRYYGGVVDMIEELIEDMPEKPKEADHERSRDVALEQHKT